LFKFLEVDHDLSVLSLAFDKFNPATGPGDYKLAYTQGVDSASIGRGKQVPIAMVAPTLLTRLNESLEKLGYTALTASWNAEPKLGHTASSAARRELATLMRRLRDGPWDFDLERLAVVADDDPELRWVVEPHLSSVRQGDGDVDLVITGAACDLVSMLTSRENIGVLLRSGRIRPILPPGDDPWASGEFPRVLNALAARVGGGKRGSRHQRT
jgi:hypothetical protein